MQRPISKSTSRPNSMGDPLALLEDETKKKKKWTMKFFKSNDPSESSKKTEASAIFKTPHHVEKPHRKNSGTANPDDITLLQEKISELETQIQSYKQARVFSGDKKGAVHPHQRERLSPMNWKDFRFKGAIFLNNKIGEEISSFEVVPDSVEFLSTSGDPCIKQTILDVNFPVAVHAQKHLTNPRFLGLFYYLRERNETRYDYLFNISLSFKSLLAEMNTFIEHKKKDEIEHGSFEITDFCHGHEIKTRFEVRPNENGDYIPVLKEFVIQISLSDDAHRYRGVPDPIFTIKTIQNYWFDLEIVRKGDEGYTLGPFSPSEQQLSMEDSHYFIEQDITIPGFSVLGAPKDSERRIEKVSSFEHIFVFNYYVRDRSQEDSSMFCMCSIEVSLAEVVRCSEGNQKLGDRFRMEKQLGLGMIRVTFHFFVGEEMIPEPSTSGQALNPLCGYWVLERVSFAIRV